MPLTAYLPGCDMTLRELRNQVRYNGAAQQPTGWREVPAMGHAFDGDSENGTPEGIQCRCGRSWLQQQLMPQPCTIASAERVARQQRQGSGGPTCKRGHPRTPEHAQRVITNGRTTWRCVTCRRAWDERCRAEQVARRREKRRQEAAARTAGMS